MVTICTEMVPGITLRNWDQSTLPDLVGPVIFLIHTESYSPTEVLSFHQLLSAQEQKKGARFRFEHHRNSYLITHGVLRTILGKYLNLEPVEIEFVSNDFGKPSLGDQYPKVYFNLSHSAGLSVVALSGESEIGVDIEKSDPEFDFELIAGAHFSKAENRFIDAPVAGSRERFYRLWTRKEALLKAIGTGIGENLDVEVYGQVNNHQLTDSFPELQDAIYYINTFEFPNNRVISIATDHPEILNCRVGELR